MERQATQPAAVPSGRKRRRVSSSKKPKGNEKAPDMKATRELEMALNALPRAEAEDYQAQTVERKATPTPTSGLVWALNALPRADPLTPPTHFPVGSIDELMERTLKDYEEECVEEGTIRPDPAKEVGEWEEHDLDQMDTQLNDLLYETCPFHPRQFIHCVNPQTQFGQLRFKCPQEGCPVYLFEDSREVMMEKLKEDTHPQVRARLQRGELKCKCGFVPKMKLSRTSKNYQKVFFSCGSFLKDQDPCGYFQWLHGPLWCPRESAQPTLRRWVKDTLPKVQSREYQPWGNGFVPVPLLKKHCLDTEKDEAPPERNFIERNRSWFNQFGEAAKTKEREQERTRHLHKNFGSMGLF